jgi:hypothetical protein
VALACVDCSWLPSCADGVIGIVFLVVLVVVTAVFVLVAVVIGLVVVVLIVDVFTVAVVAVGAELCCATAGGGGEPADGSSVIVLHISGRQRVPTVLKLHQRTTSISRTVGVEDRQKRCR